MYKKSENYFKPKDINSTNNAPISVCKYGWANEKEIIVEGKSKKLAEHAASLYMLGQKFPNNWSYGHLYEFLKENWSKKRKRANSYPFDHDKPMN